MMSKAMQRLSKKQQNLSRDAATSASLQNECFDIDEVARELKDKSEGYKTKPSQQQFANLSPEHLPPTPPSARSQSAATSAATRGSTASLLSNQRVRGVEYARNK
jgi:hypothetical protein